MPFILPLILGLLAASIALVFEITLSSFLFLPPSSSSFSSLASWPGFLLFAVLEESSKLVFIARGKYLLRKTLPPFFLFGFLFGIAFAGLEYFLLFSTENTWSLGASGILLLHLLTSLLLSFFVWRFSERKFLLFGLGGATLLHFLYNAFLFSL